MKRMKKIISLLLALTLVLGLTAVVSAAQEGTLTDGSIKIDNAVEGQEYHIYQLLYLESYNKGAAYAYKANSAWASWLKTQTTYVTIDAQGYVTWGEDADAAEFAKAAQKYAKDNGISDDGHATAASASVEFKELKLGYYLVDTSLGSLCSLDTTDPSVTIKEKNKEPVPDKQVKEDSTNLFGGENTAEIGQTVEFKTTVQAYKGAVGYVLHDKMDEGLTLNQDSIAVKVGDTSLTKDTDYTVSFTNDDNCTFEISFKQTYLDTITSDTSIEVTYSAVLNEKAVVSDGANLNQTWLNYGDESKNSSEKKETKTYTFKFDIVKTGSDNKLLTGAKFELYDAETGGNKIALVKKSDGTYRLATTEEKEADGFESAVIEAGKATVSGVDADTSYWLEEIEAPAGYNKLSGRVEVKMEKENLTTTMENDTWKDGDGGVHIVNQTGAELPSTGGMGTTLFYVIGGALVLGAVVLLVVRKRMSAGN